MNLHLLKAEGAKLRLICFLLPVVSGLVLIAVTIAQWQYHLRQGSGDDYVIFNMMYLFLPLSIFLTGAILASMVAGTEHESRGWKQLLAFPFPRFQVYLAKLFWLLILMLLKAMVIILMIILIWVLFISSPLPPAFLIKFLPDHLFWLQVSLGVSLLLLMITAGWFQRLDWK